MKKIFFALSLALMLLFGMTTLAFGAVAVSVDPYYREILVGTSEATYTVTVYKWDQEVEFYADLSVENLENDNTIAALSEFNPPWANSSGSPSVDSTLTIDTSTLAPGTYTFYVRAVDESLNFDESSSLLTLQVVPGPVSEVTISTAVPPEVAAGEGLQFSAAAYDQYKNPITDTATDPEGFTWTGADQFGFFNKTKAGYYEVYAEYAGTRSSTTVVTVKAADIDNVAISPAPTATVAAGEGLKFSAVAYDQYNNTITDTATEPAKFTWSGADENGLFNETIAQDYYVSATYDYKPSSSTIVTVTAVVPDAPTIGTATAGDGQASVSFTEPAFNGGSTITGYTVTSNPGGLTGSGTGTLIIVTGLTNGTPYTFTVTATNSAGTSAASSASNSVTPAAAEVFNIIGCLSPLDESLKSYTGVFKAGATIPIKFQILDENNNYVTNLEGGIHIDDFTIKNSANIDVLPVGAAFRYNTTSNVFFYNWKVPKNYPVGIYSVTISFSNGAVLTEEIQLVRAFR